MDNFYEPRNFPSNNNNCNYYDIKDKKSDDVVPISIWVVIMILLAIPFVNIVAVLVMAFGIGNSNISNFGKAALIVAVAALVLALILN